jgi:hypothetical protein
MNKVTVNGQEIDNCAKCPHQEVLPDPDPFDWFCDDDVKVKCNLSRSAYEGNERKEPYITVGCRPFNVGNKYETSIPNWCPVSKKEKETAKAA